jgi:hypothetical protein
MSHNTKSSKRVNVAHKSSKKRPKVDWRRQLYNDGEFGPIEAIQMPVELITRLRGIMLDIDPSLFRSRAVPAKYIDDPQKFYKRVVRPWLQRHAALRDAEVRLSGRGLHVLIWFTEPVEFTTDAERKRWAGIVKAVQAILPTDPDGPGITALTRAWGTINSKNGVMVKRLYAGKPVAKEVVLELFERLRTQPFRTVMGVLFGGERSRPCPICGDDDSTLSAMDRVGQCYGSCGKVPLSGLFDVFLRPRPGKK